MKKLLIYGAVTPPKSIDSTLTLPLRAKEAIDRIRGRFGLLHGLDYRNHLTALSFNRGDLAIALGAQQTVERSIDCETGFLDWGSLASAPAEHPVLISGSGFFHLDSDGTLSGRVNVDARQLLDGNRSYAFYGVGLNRSKESAAPAHAVGFDANDAATVRDLLSNASFVSVRDQQTADALSPHASTPIFISGDPALFLSLSPAEAKRPGDSRRPRIGINLPFHGPAATDRIRQDLPRYIDCFQRLQKSTGAALFQMVHFDTERVIGKLMQDAGLPLTIVNGSVEELQATYATLDLHVGGMLHSCILSCSVGTPCVGLAYDVKHFGFFELMQMPDFCVPSRPFDADAVLAQCQAALRRGPDLRTHIDSRRESLRNATEAYLHDALPRLMNAA